VHPIERLRFVARAQGAPASVLVEEAAVALGAFRDDPAGLVAACRRIIDRQLSCGPLWWLCARILCSPEPMAEAAATAREVAEDPTSRRLTAVLPDDATVVVIGHPEQVLDALARRGDVTSRVVDVDGAANVTVRRLGRADAVAWEVPAHGVGAAVADLAGGTGLVCLDALAVGPDAALVAAGSRAAAAVARDAGVPVWLVAGRGRVLPGRMWEALSSRWSASVDPLEAVEEELPLSLVDRAVGPTGLVDVGDLLATCDCPVAPELFRLAG
jgi:hypothetical protein